MIQSSSYLSTSSDLQLGSASHIYLTDNQTSMVDSYCTKAQLNNLVDLSGNLSNCTYVLASQLLREDYLRTTDAESACIPCKANKLMIQLRILHKISCLQTIYAQQMSNNSQSIAAKPAKPSKPVLVVLPVISNTSFPSKHGSKQQGSKQYVSNKIIFLLNSWVESIKVPVLTDFCFRILDKALWNHSGQKIQTVNGVLLDCKHVAQFIEQLFLLTRIIKDIIEDHVVTLRKQCSLMKNLKRDACTSQTHHLLTQKKNHCKVHKYVDLKTYVELLLRLNIDIVSLCRKTIVRQGELFEIQNLWNRLLEVRCRFNCKVTYLNKHNQNNHYPYLTTGWDIL